MIRLEFPEVPAPTPRKTKYFDVINKQGEKLGRIHFRPTWRKYVFTQTSPGIEFDVECLGEIAAFMLDETDRWKAGYASH
jgi:hypothetical protein